MRIALALIAVAGCGVEPNSRAAPGVEADDDHPMAAGRDAASTAAWLATGEYLTWRCEDESHAARPGSGHSRNRICSNEAIAMTPDGVPFPLGAATVKELLDSSDRIVGYAYMEKASASDGGRGWYWYEAVGSSSYAASYGATQCSGCHRAAPHDFLFTVVR